jgi:anaerobic ribonucleoside-triphosphate reductase activating protein
MNYQKINYFDTANARGLSTVLWISGCEHHCEDCFNKETWSFDSGKELTQDKIQEIIESLKNTHIKNFVLSGGDPLHPKNIDDTIKLCRQIYKNVPGITIIVYTGYTLKEIWGKEKYMHLLSIISILIEGRYDKTKPTKGLDYRGSTNQKAIHPIINESGDVIGYFNISDEYFKDEYFKKKGED